MQREYGRLVRLREEQEADLFLASNFDLDTTSINKEEEKVNDLTSPILSVDQSLMDKQKVQISVSDEVLLEKVVGIENGHLMRTDASVDLDGDDDLVNNSNLDHISRAVC